MNLFHFCSNVSHLCTKVYCLERNHPRPSHFSPPEAAKAAHQSAIGGLVVDTPPHPALGNIVGPAAMLSNLPPPYQPVNVRHLDSQSSSEEPQDYLWLVNCESKKPEPNRYAAPPRLILTLLECHSRLQASLISCVFFHLCCQSRPFCCMIFSTVQLLSSLEGDREYLLLEECESKTLPPQGSP